MVLLFKYTTTNKIYTLSLHDALQICTGYAASSEPNLSQRRAAAIHAPDSAVEFAEITQGTRIQDRWTRQIQQQSRGHGLDRESTRLNSSHVRISYADFCLKKR